MQQFLSMVPGVKAFDAHTPACAACALSSSAAKRSGSDAVKRMATVASAGEPSGSTDDG